MAAAAVSILPRQNLASRGTAIVWEDPPSRHNASGPYAAFAAALRGNPGHWAILKSIPREHAKRGWALSSGIRRGVLNDFPKGDFDATARTVDDQVRVYVRAVTR